MQNSGSIWLSLVCKKNGYLWVLVTLSRLMWPLAFTPFYLKRKKTFVYKQNSDLAFFGVNSHKPSNSYAHFTDPPINGVNWNGLRIGGFVMIIPNVGGFVKFTLCVCIGCWVLTDVAWFQSCFNGFVFDPSSLMLIWWTKWSAQGNIIWTCGKSSLLVRMICCEWRRINDEKHKIKSEPRHKI